LHPQFCEKNSKLVERKELCIKLAQAWPCPYH